MRRCMELGRYSPHAIIIVQSPYNFESQNGVITRPTVLETIRASTVVLCQVGGHCRRRYGGNRFHPCHLHEDFIVTIRLDGMHSNRFPNHSSYFVSAQELSRIHLRLPFADANF